jgi:uncharacterized protein YjbJ (UPF0337 family)
VSWEHVAESWDQLKGRLRERWPLLSDADLDRISGSRERLEDLLEELYGLEREHASREVDEFSRVAHDLSRHP